MRWRPETSALGDCMEEATQEEVENAILALERDVDPDRSSGESVTQS